MVVNFVTFNMNLQENGREFSLVCSGVCYFTRKFLQCFRLFRAIGALTSIKVASTSFQPFNCVNFEIKEQKLRPGS